jgi:predicted ATPase
MRHHGHARAAACLSHATLLRLSKYGLEPVTVEQTDHTQPLREFFGDPKGLMEAAIGE